MHQDDSDEYPLFLGEYIKSNPSSALSALWVFDLPEEEQGDFLAMMIENAVYQETWLAYFEYAEKKGILVTEEIALEAIHEVGLDPYSAPLWLKIINLSSDEEKKRELFHLALRVPLYQQNILYEAYKTFESEFIYKNGQTISGFLQFSEIIQYSDILNIEPNWPDRFVDIKISSDTCKDMVCSQWNNLLRSMLDNTVERCISQDLHLRRIDLAFRQLCSQFPHECVCWYAYACFVAVDMKDKPQAMEIIEKGNSYIDKNSIPLQSLDALLYGSNFASMDIFKKIMNEGLFEQRLCAMVAKDTLPNRKRFRDIGKLAAAKNVSDWRIYHQWASAEKIILQDSQMTSKVYEKGMHCVSKSLKDAILLSNEAAKYHLWKQDEREVLGYAERQIELISSSQHEGLIRASWNHLVNLESTLGLPSLPKTLRRRTEHCNDLPYKSIIERYRVGNYTPCSGEDLDWLEYVDDLAKAKKEEQEPIFESYSPLKYRTLSVIKFSCCNPFIPDLSLWSSFDMVSNRENSSTLENPDEVVGSRTLRGRLVYKLKINEKTEARLKREEQMRKFKEGDELGGNMLRTTNSALQALVEKISAKKWNPTQIRLCSRVNADWLMTTLTLGELDLLKKRS